MQSDWCDKRSPTKSARTPQKPGTHQGEKSASISASTNPFDRAKTGKKGYGRIFPKQQRISDCILIAAEQNWIPTKLWRKKTSKLN
jgi:hypothetical protein